MGEWSRVNSCMDPPQKMTPRPVASVTEIWAQPHIWQFEQHTKEQVCRISGDWFCKLAVHIQHSSLMCWTFLGSVIYCLYSSVEEKMTDLLWIANITLVLDDMGDWLRCISGVLLLTCHVSIEWLWGNDDRKVMWLLKNEMKQWYAMVNHSDKTIKSKSSKYPISVHFTHITTIKTGWKRMD